MENDYKIVKFDLYCKTCKHLPKKESEEPCAECLETPAQLDSRQPINWEAK